MNTIHRGVDYSLRAASATKASNKHREVLSNYNKTDYRRVSFMPDEDAAASGADARIELQLLEEPAASNLRLCAYQTFRLLIQFICTISSQVCKWRALIVQINWSWGAALRVILSCCGVATPAANTQTMAPPAACRWSRRMTFRTHVQLL